MEYNVEKLKIKSSDHEKLDWNQRMLIISTKRLFIVMEKGRSATHEIVDSIPMEDHSLDGSFQGNRAWIRRRHGVYHP